MKGTDVPQVEIERAAEFLRITQHGLLPERWITTREQFIRMLAWYGAIRANGDGSGKFIVNEKSPAE